MQHPTRWPVEIPTRLRPLEIIGVGTQATVWKARDGHLGVDVAVKVGHARLETVVDAGSDDDRAEAERAADSDDAEVRSLARLRYIEGIVRIDEVGRCRDGRPWMAMQLMTGGTLEQRRGLAPDDLLHDALRLAEALDAAHSAGVAHGDISPRNVLYDAHGSAHLADFGASLLDGAAAPPGRLTPAVAAPERLRGGGADPASDVYSLAATLLWALEGEEPHWARHLHAATAPRERPTAASLADALRRELASPR